MPRSASIFHLLLWAAIAGMQFHCSTAETADQVIHTVNGNLAPQDLGLTLIHEHVFLDWTPADSMNRDLWNDDEAFEVILPYLQEMVSVGVESFLECTPAYLGRNPMLLQRLSNETGLQILTNTGFYAARNQQHIPTYLKQQTSKQISQIWIDECHHGIDKTGIKPGFIKIGVDSKDQLDSLDIKIVEAAAMTHLATGLTIVGHTGTDTTAIQQIKILRNFGVDPSAFVWTHAQRGTSEGHLHLAREGVWISLDGLGWIPESITDQSGLVQYITFLQNLKENDLLNRTLISHDAGWYTVGNEDQSTYKRYTTIFEVLIPALHKEGFTQQDIDQMLIQNPREAYTLAVRAMKPGR